jgi:hypothetical protein
VVAGRNYIIAAEGKGETKWEINKTEGCGAGWLQLCRKFSAPTPPHTLVQPFDRNFVPHWKTRAVCFHAANNSPEPGGKKE